MNEEPQESLEAFRWPRARQWRVSIAGLAVLALLFLALNASRALFAFKTRNTDLNAALGGSIAP